MFSAVMLFAQVSAGQLTEAEMHEKMALYFDAGAQEVRLCACRLKWAFERLPVISPPYPVHRPAHAILRGGQARSGRCKRQSKSG